MGSGVSLQARVALNIVAIFSIVFMFAMLCFFLYMRTYRNRLRMWGALIDAKRGDFNTLSFAGATGLEMSRDNVMRMRGADLAIIHADNPRQDKETYPAGSTMLRALNREHFH